ncbi:AMP-binding protein [Gordonia sp. (in: high G+C Gram-positive bacteria)]|uniref:AMP-binding protein n=1 Tax=Gordonia sp. (in: high G+C Gram-positive bacteria) TaxID=84139 RepID=UPI001694A040|nr:AMP-binding protein [Gordonia sp. (in: high G+C Gram-positive bacteria)]NLG48052.1 AMP-binding protein [Gordonia sp. (in: high G+C Gram-positive bacteria)]
MTGPADSALSYAAGESHPPLLTQTIGATLAATAAKFPDSDALIDAAVDRTWTYAEFRRDVLALAAGLLRHGVTPGDRVALWAPNRFEWVLTQFAAAEIGAILVVVNPSYRRHELAYALTQSGTSLVLSAERFRDSEYAVMLDDVRDQAPDLREVVLFESETFAQMLTEASADELAKIAEIAAGLRPEDPINIQYTSGTTGSPKGVTLTHRNIGNNGYLVGSLLEYTDADRICLPVPFYHCFGMVMGNLAAIAFGCTMVIPAPGFDARATLAAVEKYRCTSLYGVPTMFIAELALLDAGEKFDLSSLRTGIMAGSPCPEQVMRRVIDEMNMSQVSICYGMTETSPVSTQTRMDDALDLRVSTVGRVGPHLEIKIADPVTGETLPRGETGEFRTRGYSVMTGYWNDPEKTAEAVDEDGWMRTGDLGVMAGGDGEEAGYVRITGRIKDMVIRGGENIYPREIEEFLYTHPDIVDAQVIGVPDEKYGEELMAWVQLREGAPEVTVETIREFATGNISRHKIPKYVHVVEAFPMTVTGKVRKIEMREQSIEFLGLE